MPDTQPIRFPLTVSPQNRDETTSRDAKLINGFVELGEQGEAWVYKRPGLLLSMGLPAAAGQGCFLWQGSVYSIFGGKLFKDTNPVAGTVNSAGGIYSWGTCLGKTPKLFFQNGIAAYTYDDTNGIVVIPTANTVVQSGSVSHGSPVITGLADTSQLRVGASLVFATGNISTSATIKSIDSVSQITLTDSITLPLLQFTASQSPAGLIIPPISAPYPTVATLTNVTPSTASVGTGAYLRSPAGTAGQWEVSGQQVTVNAIPNNSQLVLNFPYFINFSGISSFPFAVQNIAIPNISITFSNPGLPAATVVKGYAYLDGTGYVLTSDSFVRGSDFNNLQSWPTLNSLPAQIEPDAGVFIAKQLSYVIALKQYSIEVFRDAGNPVGSPLTSVDGSKVTTGCRHAGSVQTMEGMLFCIGQVKGGGVNVIMLENLHAVVISTNAIERLLQAWNYSNIYSWVVRLDGHYFYGITSPGSNMTLVYDTKTHHWMQWADANGNYFPIVAATNNTLQVPVLQHESNGKLYTLSSTAYTDDGTIFTVDIITPIFDGGTRKKKYLKLIDVVADQPVKGTLQIRNSDDDYQSWTNFRPVNLALSRPTITNCGTFRRRAYHVRHAVNAPLRLKALELQLDIGTL